MKLHIQYLSKVIVTTLLVNLMTGCNVVEKVFPDRSEDYKKSKSTKRLEVPPDLTTTTMSDSLIVNDESASLSDYTARQQQVTSQAGTSVLPTQEDAYLKRDRDRIWLVVKGEPDAVWPRAHEFWLEQGFLIVTEDPATGILETDWEENRRTIPQGPIRGLLGKVFDSAYTSSLRDKYRMRLERGEQAGTTEVFITHQGIEEELEGEPDQIRTSVWVPRPSDPELEAEKIKQLMVYLGVEPEQAASLEKAAQPVSERASLLKGDADSATLVVHEDFSRAWRSIGIALDRVGFAVEDRNRTAGTYYVKYRDVVKQENKKGLFSKLAFWSGDAEAESKQYQIKLTEDGPDTRTTVLDAEGNPETSATALRILNLLYEKLK